MSPETSWSAKDKDHWLVLHLSRPAEVDQIDIASASKDKFAFHVETSLNGRAWKKVFEGETAGKLGEKKLGTSTPGAPYGLAQVVGNESFGVAIELIDVDENGCRSRTDDVKLVDEIHLQPTVATG